ncbi:hypothetical protein AD935_14500 [Gluconobacter japonicus]|nr:hypothetical protein AD935_14500 [Gluconobacter japonicus]
MRWFLGALDRAFDCAELVLGKVIQKARFWDNLAGQSINDRQRLVLNRLLDGVGGKLTSSKWAKLAKMSPDTALRDINDIVSRDILVREAAGGSSTSYRLVFPRA